ncbi:MAG: hypothetical protein WCA35_18745 [Kovacikia sp.]
MPTKALAIRPWVLRQNAAVASNLVLQTTQTSVSRPSAAMTLWGDGQSTTEETTMR